MTGFPTANFSDTAKGLFTPFEIRQLMKVEYERALRYDYPIAMMLIEVDRLEYLHDLYGYESKEEILHAVISLLRSITRESDFLGCMMNDRVLTVIPHTSRKAATALAGRLLQGSRRLAFQSDGRSLRATLSVGIASSEEPSELTFEQFVDSAVEALAFAIEAGGDRFVLREPAAQVIQELRTELEQEAQKLSEQQAEVRRLHEEEERQRRILEEQERHLQQREDSRRVTKPVRVGEVDELADDELAQRIRELFQGLGEKTPELEGLQDEVLSIALDSLRLARDQAVAAKVAEHESQVDVLERRVMKLKDLLDATEAELKRVAKMKGTTPGVASIYRSVQGLSEDEGDYERKKEMLSLIFEANVDLLKKIKGDS